MCVFCAAAPATLALGVAGQARQTQDWRENGRPSGVRSLPLSAVALLAALGMAMAAAVVHSRWVSG
jgi:hypothetical protein